MDVRIRATVAAAADAHTQTNTHSIHVYGQMTWKLLIITSTCASLHFILVPPKESDF